MSIDGAIGRIDQILQLQQQIFDPAATTAATTSAATATPASSTTASTSGQTSSSSFASALAQAEAASTSTSTESSALAALDPSATDTGDSGDSGATMSADLSSSTPDSSLASLLLPALEQDAGTSTASGSASAAAPTVSATSGPAGGTATSVEDPRVQAMVSEADSLVGEPYVWGGGHSGWGSQPGYDCSGFVSAVLHAGGYLSAPQDTETLPTAAGIEPGPGQYVTVYDRTAPGQEGHVIIDIAGQFYESGGEAGSWGGGGGVEKIGTPSATYLATFNDVLHPAGL